MQRMDIRRPVEHLNPKEYHTDLSRQAEERHQRNRIDKTQSRDLAQHVSISMSFHDLKWWRTVLKLYQF